MTFLNHLKNAANTAYTQNGAVAYATTKSALLDLFAQGGALRTRDEKSIVGMFTRAFAENELLAMKMLFYFRDVRGGQGERRTFRTILTYMANNHTEVMSKNIHLIPEFGRWDDLFVLFGTPLEKQALAFIKEQFEKDLKSDTPSLLGKWMKSENASSQETKELATKTRKYLGLTSKQYRKALSKLRNQIKIVETLMSSNQWSSIEYDKLPSKAGLKYRNAFNRHDGQRYQEFIASLQRGEAKVNAKTLFPYEIVKQLGRGQDAMLDAMWKNLPDYIGNAEENSIAVVDTSASMTWYFDALAMNVALSLGLYLAERNKGQFHNHFITFNTNPSLVEIKGKTLAEKINSIMRAGVGGSTNIEAVFDLILNTAIMNKVPQNEMINKIYIISDMEFNAATSGRTDKKLFELIKEKYQNAGYEMPNLVFWNVNAMNEQFPMTMDDRGVQFVSGCSPSIFTNLMKGNFLTPYELMLDVLNNPRYDVVTV